MQDNTSSDQQLLRGREKHAISCAAEQSSLITEFKTLHDFELNGYTALEKLIQASGYKSVEQAVASLERVTCSCGPGQIA